MQLTTLCYIEKDDCYLMMHRVKKEVDINAGKWIGVGGKLEPDESVSDCLLREVLEETGLMLTSFRYRGVITFVYNDHPAEYMHLFTADAFTGKLRECDEGVLKWVDKKSLMQLNLWQGDRIFLRLLLEDAPAFTLTLVYRDDTLLRAVLDGELLPPESAGITQA